MARRRGLLCLAGHHEVEAGHGDQRAVPEGAEVGLGPHAQPGPELKEHGDILDLRAL